MVNEFQEILEAWYMAGGQMTGPVPAYIAALALSVLLFLIEAEQSGDGGDDTPITVGWLRRRAENLLRGSGEPGK